MFAKAKTVDRFFRIDYNEYIKINFEKEKNYEVY